MDLFELLFVWFSDNFFISFSLVMNADYPKKQEKKRPSKSWGYQQPSWKMGMTENSTKISEKQDFNQTL